MNTVDMKARINQTIMKSKWPKMRNYDISELVKGKKVVPIDKNLPHKVSEVMCWKCGARWLAVRPENVILKQLECIACGETGFCFETGEVIERVDE